MTNKEELQKHFRFHKSVTLVQEGHQPITITKEYCYHLSNPFHSGLDFMSLDELADYCKLKNLDIASIFKK
ncbi:MAG: hypothetical protein MJ172_01690 [Clostridia bacterium]|nr:hypothetical protein [Clostridia bacterium]